MTTYYIRKSGSDSSAGTSPAAAWATVGKALGASGAVLGDTVYVAPGVYREIVTVNAAAAGVVLAGDPLGQQTGDAPGEVVLSGYPNGPYAAASTSSVITATSVDGLTIRDVRFLSGTAYGISLTTLQGWTIERCVFSGMGTTSSTSGGINCVTAYGEDQGLTIRDCIFGALRYGLRVWMDRGGSGDYDADIQVMRCLFLCQFPCAIETTGAGANYGGGVDVANCTCVDPEYWLLKTNAATISISIPCTVKDSLSILGGIASANTSGQITDSGGNIGSIANANLTAHATSRLDTTPIVEVMYSLGHEWLWGLPTKQPFSVAAGSALIGFEGAETVDTGNVRAALDGTGIYGDSGTCTSANNDDLSDSSKAWGVNQWKGWLLRITGGTGSGQVKRINANTATELDISGAAPSGGLWATTPSTDSTYIIYQGPPVETGKATAGSDTTITDSGANWATNQWAGYTVAAISGTANGESKTVSSNTSTVLTTPSWTTDPDNTTVYALYKDSLTAVQAAPGALAAHDTGRPLETVSGSSRLPIDGYGSQMFEVPVLAQATTLSVRARYDSNHGTDTKPQFILLAQGDLDVATETITMSSGADTDETLTLTEFTPSAAGIVRVIVQSRSSTPYGRAFFDELTRSY